MTQDKTTSIPLFVERALAEGPRTTMGGHSGVRDGVAFSRSWTITTRVLPEPYRGFWIFESLAPESDSEHERESYHAYPADPDGYQWGGECHSYAGGIAAIYAQIDARIAWREAHMAAQGAEVAAEVAAPMQQESTASTASSRSISCPNCGAPTLPELLMSASLGTACPACYDELSS